MIKSNLMKYKLFVLTIVLSSASAWAQVNAANENIETRPPIFPGCEDLPVDQLRDCLGRGIMNHIARNFVFPKEAREKSIQGKIFINMVIEKDGTIKDVTVKRGVDPLLDQAGVDVIKSLPRMQPALDEGQPVRIQYTVPINANLGTANDAKSKKKKK